MQFASRIGRLILPHYVADYPLSFALIILIMLSSRSSASESNTTNCPDLYASLFAEPPSSLVTNPPANCSLSEVRLVRYGLQGALNSPSASGLSVFDKLTILDLAHNELSGPIPAFIWDLPSLFYLDLSYNRFIGSLSPSLWSNLSHLNLSFNSFQGPLLDHNDRSNATRASLITLVLSHNQLNGSIPQSLCRNTPNLLLIDVGHNNLSSGNFSECAKLTVLDASSNQLQGSQLLSTLFGADDQRNRSNPAMQLGLSKLSLSNNSLDGAIPSLERLGNLTHLDLSYNNLSGDWPGEDQERFLIHGKLSSLNVSHNNLTINLDDSAITRKFGNSSFDHNLKEEAASPAPAYAADSRSNSSATRGAQVTISSPPSSLPAKPAAHSKVGVIAGTIGAAIAGMVAVVATSIILCRMRRNADKKKKGSWDEATIAGITEIRPPANFECAELFSLKESTWAASVKDPVAVRVVIFEKPLLNLNFGDLLRATSSFAEAGGDEVYTCTLPGVCEGEAKVVIKVVEGGRRLCSREAERAFQAMGKLLRHENLVPLLGYCIAGEEKLLIYKYMEGGTLEDALHALPEGLLTHDGPDDWDREDELVRYTHCQLGWAARVHIALGAARGLAYLHQGCPKLQLVHGALCSGCILLDGGGGGGGMHTARLANYAGAFGLPRCLPPGYAAPECSGRVSAPCPEADVYSFGMVLMELATARRPLGSYAAGCSSLVAWVRLLAREKRMEAAVDPSLLRVNEGEEQSGQGGPRDCALGMLRAAYLCTADVPSKRPSMQQVVGLLKDLVTAS